MDFGPNAMFIWASYSVVAIVLVALTGWLVVEGSRLQRSLDGLEQRGIRRRPGAEPRSEPPSRTGPQA